MRRILVVESPLTSVQEDTRKLSHGAVMLHAEILGDELAKEAEVAGVQGQVTAEVFFV